MQRNFLNIKKYMERGPKLDQQYTMISQKELETNRSVEAQEETPRLQLTVQSPTPSFISPKQENSLKRQQRSGSHEQPSDDGPFQEKSISSIISPLAAQQNLQLSSFNSSYLQINSTKARSVSQIGFSHAQKVRPANKPVCKPTSHYNQKSVMQMPSQYLNRIKQFNKSFQQMNSEQPGQQPEQMCQNQWQVFMAQNSIHAQPGPKVNSKRCSAV